MAAERYQNLGVDVGLVQGPGGFASREAAAIEQRGQAIAGLGSAVVDFATQMNRAQNVARLYDAQTKALVAFNDLEQEFKHDTDYQTAAARFEEKSKKIIGGLTAEASLAPEFQAHFQQSMTRLQLSVGKSVQTNAWAGEQSKFLANLDQADVAYQARLGAAGSDIERAAILEEQQNGVAGGVSHGWLNAEAGQRRVSAFRHSYEFGRALELSERNPNAAVAALGDPAQFSYLSPAERQSLQRQAKNAVDHHGQLEVGNLSLRSPARAALTVGKAADPATRHAIFEAGIVGAESGGDPNVQDSRRKDGTPVASGIAQMVPGTAREVAKQLKLGVFDGLDDEGVRNILRTRPELSKRLGEAYFSQGLDRYGNDIAAAAAFYNAGPGNADLYVKGAIAKFGPNYTPEQFVSVIPEVAAANHIRPEAARETQNYVPTVFRKGGARMDALGMSENARLAAQTHVAQAVHSERAQFLSAIKQNNADYETDHNIVARSDRGEPISLAEAAPYRAGLIAAVNGGDAESARKLRHFDQQMEIYPLREAAYRMPPAQLQQEVAALETKVFNGEATPYESRALDVMQHVLSDTAAKAKTDPLGLASRAGAIRVEDLPVSAPLSPQFGAALTTRNVQAITAASLYRADVNPFRPAETEALKDWYQQASPKDRVGLARQFAATLDPRVASTAMKSITPRDKLLATAGMIALRDPALGQKVMEGAALLDSKWADDKKSEVRAALGDLFGGKVYYSTETQSEAIEAGLAVYAANRANSASLFDAMDRAGIESAIQEVTGKVVTINGARTPIPPGLASGSVTRALGSLTEQDFALFGGLQPSLTPADVISGAQYHARAAGGSEYSVTLGRDPVMTAALRPMVIDMARLVAAQEARGVKHYSSAEEAQRDIHDAAMRRKGAAAVPSSPQEEALGLALFDKGAPLP